MSDTGDIVIYETDDGSASLEVVLDGDTIWLSQAQMAELFGVSVSSISRHLANIYDEGEIKKTSTIRNLQKVQMNQSGTPIRPTNSYNLDAVISVGYRVNSKRAVAFRQWATAVLREYVTKGFALDDERLKGNGGGSYWHELLDRIRDIRSSEKVLYRQVLDLYATAVDYEPKAKESLEFFKIVQNKLHFAAHGHTAAEVIYERADADKPFMGLTTFKGQQVTLADVTVAKNYLDERELKRLNNLVSGFFDLAELRAQNHVPTYMADYVEQLDGIIKSVGGSVLKDAGKVNHVQAVEKAKTEYRKYQDEQISPVDEAFLDSLKSVEKSLPKE